MTLHRKRYVHRMTCDQCGCSLTNESRAMFFRHVQQHANLCDNPTPTLWAYEADTVAHPSLF